MSNREDAATFREQALRAREESARARTELEALADQLREANEHLVVAHVRAQSLAEKIGHLAAIVASSDDAIYSKTLEGVITSWNRGAERIYGYTAEEAIGAPVSMLAPVDRRDELPMLLERLARGETIDRLETVRARKDGTRIDVALMISPIKDDAGRILAAAAISRDITEHKSAEKQRAALLQSEQEARTEAETANHLKDEFLATVSHELRTPLNAVLGWARIVTSHQLDREREAQALESIERNAAALARIIDDLLDMSRIAAGRLSLASEPVDLVAVARAAFDAVGPMAADRHVELGFRVDPHAIGLVTGDAGRLHQVIANLLTNAIKFTPAGSRVDVSIARVDADMQVQVVDTGRGIEPAVLPLVFDRFWQAESGTSRPQGGLGLGLAIVRDLVEAHGGTVRVESEGPGRGTTFAVRFPVSRADTMHVPLPVLQPPRASTAPAVARLDGVHVLVVDDNLDGRTLTAYLLAHFGATVSAVPSAREALRAVETEPVQVLVTDIGLPDEDGFSLLAQLRRQEAGRGRFTPAIALTGYGGVGDRRRALDAGFQRYIVKPFESAELVASIASLVEASSRAPAPADNASCDSPTATSSGASPSPTAATSDWPTSTPTTRVPRD